MTDKEKIRYILNWSNRDCRIIVIVHKNEHTTDEITIGDVADIIRSQQAEIERLKAKCENTQIGYTFAKDESKELKKEKYRLQKALNQSEDYRLIAKAKAIKEFAEKIADVFYSHDKGDTYVREVVYNLVKEMVGEQE